MKKRAAWMIGLILFFLAVEKSQAVYLEEVPLTIRQPDGNEVVCYVSGDEYYNWLHDRDHFTIVKNPQTGYYVYAVMVKGELAPSEYLVGRDAPAAAGLTPRLNIQPTEMRERRQNSLMSLQVLDNQPSPNSGTLTNLVVYIRFADDAEFTDKRSLYERAFNDENAGAHSVRNYFSEISYGALSVHSSFYPVAAGETVISYRDDYPRGYFKPIADHPQGYGSESEKSTREQGLLKRAIEGIRDQVPAGLDLDGDDDGRIDNVVFIIYGNPTAWNTLLWPHAWSLYQHQVAINGKRVYSYNLQMQSFLGSGQIHIICHELLHSVGFPDLYHYTSDGIQPVSGWDIMASPSSPPQHPCAYTKWKYGKWIGILPIAAGNGTYELKPLTEPQQNCFKILSPSDPTGGQYFIVEYRRKISGTFEQNLPGEGLLVYRIDRRDTWREGNAVPPDEIYLYRPGGSSTWNGNTSKAAMSLETGRRSINDFTDPACFLAGGEPGGLDLFNVGSLGEKMVFSLGSNRPAAPVLLHPADLSPRVVLHPTLEWSMVPGASTYHLQVATNPECTSPSFDRPGLTSTSYSLPELLEKTHFYWRVAAANQAGIGPWSGVWAFSTADQPPAMPSGISLNPCIVCR